MRHRPWLPRELGSASSSWASGTSGCHSSASRSLNRAYKHGVNNRNTVTPVINRKIVFAPIRFLPVYQNYNFHYRASCKTHYRSSCLRNKKRHSDGSFVCRMTLLKTITQTKETSLCLSWQGRYHSF